MGNSAVGWTSTIAQRKGALAGTEALADAIDIHDGDFCHALRVPSQPVTVNALSIRVVAAFAPQVS